MLARLLPRDVRWCDAALGVVASVEGGVGILGAKEDAVGDGGQRVVGEVAELLVKLATWAEAVLAASPAEVVVIGLGAVGAFLAVRGMSLRLHMPAVVTHPVVQTGGAGDALFAAFLHGYLRARDPVRALRAATVFASYKIGEAGSGAGYLCHDALERLLAEVDGAAGS